MELFLKKCHVQGVCHYSSFHAECVTGDLAAELREVGVALQLLCIAPDVVETPIRPEVRGGGEEARQIECSSTSLSWSCRLQVRRIDCGHFCAFSQLKFALPNQICTSYTLIISEEAEVLYVFGIKMNCNAARILEITFV
jgi:hypothetical protein